MKRKGLLWSEQPKHPFCCFYNMWQHATHAVHPPGFASGLWAMEVAFGGDLGMLELRRHLDAVCYHVNGDSSSHLLLFGWVKFIKPSPLTHILTYKNPLFLQLLFSFFSPHWTY